VPDSVPHHVSNVFEQNGKLYLKTFLIDDSVNHANWGVRPDYIAKHIDRFVGRPFILTKHRNHPYEFYGAIREDYNDVPGTINRYLHAQEKYRIGTIKKVEPYAPPSSSIEAAGDSKASASTPSVSNENAWFAYIEITDPVAISAFKAGAIPKYVSPTIFRLKHSDRPEETTDFEPLHLAAVDVPAYGFDKAGIRGSCEGDLVKCSSQLSQASSSIEDCGFCIKGTLEGFSNRFDLDANSSFVKSGLKQGSELTENKENSVPAAQNPAPSDTQKQEQQQQPQQQAPIEPNKTGEGQPFTKVEPEQKPTKEEPAKKEQQPKQETGAEQKEKDNNNKQTKSTSSPEVAELTKTVQALLQEVNGLKSYKETQEKTVRDQKDAARRSKIEAAIPENYANSSDERKKAVDILMRYDNDEQLDYVLNSFVAPTINAANKPRAVQQPRSNKITDYGTAKANSVQQGSAAIQPPVVDIEKMRRVVAMSDIVGNASAGGGF
jgi:hypothetical protein